MKRHPALIPLSQDHHQGLLLAQLIKKDAPNYNGLPKDLIGKMNYAQEVYTDDLVQHFKDEEELVFPFLKGKNEEVDKLISEILNEHILLKQKILALDKNSDLINQLDEIGNLLEGHIRKEERILFEKAQLLLNEEELKMIEKKFDENRPNKSCKNKTE
ncbi:MAG: hemerythrin domain-containing protein [Ignavibacteriales bacterium]|nr:hemerythrin domain-containing protein [Ignavibacteriales bacterium]